MATIHKIQWSVSGDVGGVGVSRFWVENAAHTLLSSGECDTAGAAISGFFDTLRPYFPSSITWSPESPIEGYDVATAIPVGITGYGSVPAAKTGSDGSHYGAGLGARINLATGIVVGRRFLRGALMFVPLGSASYNAADGSVSLATQAAIQGAYAAMDATLVAAGLQFQVWHRPKPIGSGTGVAYSVSQVSVSKTPAGLRSRRV